jgi:hypothetical protein
VLDDTNFESRSKQNKFLFSKNTHAGSGFTRTPMQWTPSSFPSRKRLGSEVEESTTSTSVVKNDWRYTSLPRVCFMAKSGTTLSLPLPLIGAGICAEEDHKRHL